MADIITIKFDPPRIVRSVTDKAIGLYNPINYRTLLWIPRLVIAGDVPSINSSVESIRLQKWWADKWLPKLTKNS